MKKTKLFLLITGILACTNNTSEVTRSNLENAGSISISDAQYQIEHGDKKGFETSDLSSMPIIELMEKFGVPGVSLAVIHNFAIHWAKGYGVADIETGQTTNTETMFQAASISKPVAAMGVLKAAQNGLFDLDDDINDILLSWDLDGEGFTENRYVTPRTLTSHTSGLGDGFGFPGYDPEEPLPTTVQILEGHDLSNVGGVFMEREPLTYYEYSGGGVTLMELALSDVHNRSFVDLMREEILNPLGMKRSSYAQPISSEHDKNAARAHDREGESRGPKWHVYPEHAAAGLWTTPTDLSLFIIEIQLSAQGNSNRILSQTMVQEMLNPVGVGPFSVGFSVSKHGEGWYFSHSGSNWGFRALTLAHKVKGYGLVIMTNGDRGSEVINEIRKRIEHTYEWDSFDSPVVRTY